MKRRHIAWIAAPFLAIGLSSQLIAQQPLPGEDGGSLALHFGAVAPMQDLPDGTSFNSGVAGGISATVWPFKNVGVRGAVTLSQSGGGLPRGTTGRPGDDEPKTGFYSLELAVRQPMAQGRFAWFPYAAAGIGGKQYWWTDKYRTSGIEWDLAFAWTMSGGVDIRPASAPRYGLVVDVSRFSSKYIWHGFMWDRPSVSDLRVTAGVSMNW